jgi:hypothetical protein
VAGQAGADGSDSGAVKRCGCPFGLDSVAADELDGITAGERSFGERASHASQADDADAAHDVSHPVAHWFG